MSKVIETKTGWMIRCRSCKWHEIPKVGRPGATWAFNGNMDRPTFTPSINESVNQPDMGESYNPEVPSRRCHFIITDGNINYCSDCSHSLAGTTVELESYSQQEIDVYKAMKALEGW